MVSSLVGHLPDDQAAIFKETAFFFSGETGNFFDRKYLIREGLCQNPGIFCDIRTDGAEHTHDPCR
jgi:hypothetical protein